MRSRSPQSATINAERSAGAPLIPESRAYAERHEEPAIGPASTDRAFPGARRSPRRCQTSRVPQTSRNTGAPGVVRRRPHNRRPVLIDARSVRRSVPEATDRRVDLVPAQRRRDPDCQQHHRLPATKIVAGLIDARCARAGKSGRQRRTIPLREAPPANVRISSCGSISSMPAVPAIAAASGVCGLPVENKYAVVHRQPAAEYPGQYEQHAAEAEPVVQCLPAAIGRGKTRSAGAEPQHADRGARARAN